MTDTRSVWQTHGLDVCPLRQQLNYPCLEQRWNMALHCLSALREDIFRFNGLFYFVAQYFLHFTVLQHSKQEDDIHLLSCYKQSGVRNSMKGYTEVQSKKKQKNPQEVMLRWLKMCFNAFSFILLQSFKKLSNVWYIKITFWRWLKALRGSTNWWNFSQRAHYKKWS